MSSGYCERCNREIWANSEREDLCADCENELLREQCASLRARLEEAEHEIDRLRAAENAAFHAFVAGAKWWEYRSTGGTMWPSDLREVEEEARRHYPYAPHLLVVEAQKKAAELEQELERLRAVAEAAKALIDRIEFVDQNERYKAVWHIAQLHLGPYDGPQYKDQVDALKQAIMALEEAKSGE